MGRPRLAHETPNFGVKACDTVPVEPNSSVIVASVCARIGIELFLVHFFCEHTAEQVLGRAAAVVRVFALLGVKAARPGGFSYLYRRQT